MEQDLLILTTIASEELIPGRVYDTLDMEVYTHMQVKITKVMVNSEIKYTSFTDPSGSLHDFSQFGDPQRVQTIMNILLCIKMQLEYIILL